MSLSDTIHNDGHGKRACRGSNSETLCCIAIDRFYIALFSALVKHHAYVLTLEQTPALRSHVMLHELLGIQPRAGPGERVGQFILPPAVSPA